MLDATHLERITLALAHQSWPVTLLVRGKAEHPLSSQLAELAAELARVGGSRLLLREGGEGAPAAPALTLVDPAGRRVRYLAAPEGHQVGPFVDAVVGMAHEPAWAREAAPQGIETLSRDVDLKVFVGAACTHCPVTVRSALRLALATPHVQLSVIDAQHFPDLAARFGVRSVPLTVIDDGVTLIGEFSTDALLQRLRQHGNDAYRLDLFRSLVEHGRFDEAAARICEPRCAVPFVILWRDSATAQRVALLLTVEKALEQDASALDPVVGGMLPLLASGDAALRGDTADLLGRIGNDQAREALKPLLSDSNPDVAEIAAEALEEIAQRNQPS